MDSLTDCAIMFAIFMSDSPELMLNVPDEAPPRCRKSRLRLGALSLDIVFREMCFAWRDMRQARLENTNTAGIDSVTAQEVTMSATSHK